MGYGPPNASSAKATDVPAGVVLSMVMSDFVYPDPETVPADTVILEGYTAFSVGYALGTVHVKTSAGKILVIC